MVLPKPVSSAMSRVTDPLHCRFNTRQVSEDPLFVTALLSAQLKEETRGLLGGGFYHMAVLGGRGASPTGVARTANA